MTARGYNFDVGTVFHEHGRTYAVIDTSRQKRVLRDQDSQEITLRNAAQLHKQYVHGSIQLKDLFTSSTERGPAKVPTIEKSLADFSEAVRDQVKVKRHYLDSLCPRGRVTCRRSELPHKLTKLHQALKETMPKDRWPPRPPSVSTFYDWRKAWVNSFYSFKSLVSRFDLRGRRPAELPEGLQPILERAVDEFYAQPNRPTLSETLDRAETEVNALNRLRSPMDQLPRPTRRQLQRIIDSLDRFTMLQRRHGTAHARKATRVFGRKNEPKRLLERVELDHTPLDVICVADETGLIVGRPHLTVLIDVRSRMIMGAWISFRPPNAATVLRALKHAILPKDELLKSYGLKGPWPARGVMSMLLLDNGKELHSNALESAAFDLGITLVYCPPRQPFFKGVIERFLQEINYRFIHQLPGTTFAKYYLRNDYDSLKHAVIPIEDLRRLVYRWIVEVYNKHFHRALQNCPLEVWMERDGHPDFPVLPRRLDVLDVYMTPVEERVLSSKGIEINSLFYTSPELSDLRLRRGNQSLKVRPNPDDMGFIHVLHPESNTYFKAPCTWPDYADGITHEQNEWFRRRSREAYKALPHRAALLSAKRDMQEEARQMVETHQQLLSKALENSEGKKASSPGTDKSQKRLKPRGSRSGLGTQCQAEVLASVRAEQPTEEPASSVVSFDDIEAFESSQSELF